jgi:signal transduction histidine kinase
VKYTPENGEIRVTLRESRLPGERVCIAVSVRDNGVGMSGEFQKVLFDPFTQEHRSDTFEARGTGLGLAVVKRIIDAMGGSIRVKSKTDRARNLILDRLRLYRG